MKNKNVLITGGTGSLGYALAQRFLELGNNVTIFSRDEKKQYDMKKIFPECRYVLGDMRDAYAVENAVKGQDIVIHAASLKYVNISELQPTEYVQTNVLGTINLLQAIDRAGTVERCVGISTDKVCEPVNTYGMTKALLEKLFLEAHVNQGKKPKTKFTVARYGNVIGTRGSVIPFWQEKREAGEVLPVTNPDMTRFFFSLDDAVELIFKCLEAKPGLIISKAMASVTLGQLAETMQGPEGWIVVGERPGEKHHEKLLTADEMRKTTKDGDYFVFDPNGPNINTLDGSYTSHNCPRLVDAKLRELIGEYL